MGITCARVGDTGKVGEEWLRPWISWTPSPPGFHSPPFARSMDAGHCVCGAGCSLYEVMQQNGQVGLHPTYTVLNTLRSGCPFLWTEKAWVLLSGVER